MALDSGARQANSWSHLRSIEANGCAISTTSPEPRREGKSQLFVSDIEMRQITGAHRHKIDDKRDLFA